MSGATIILAALQNGSPLPADLDVAVSLRGGGLEILPWQVVYTGSWEPDGYLILWDGT